MGCDRCGYTGESSEYDETAGPGYIAIPCPYCHSTNGDMPDAVADLHDAATEAEIDEAWRQYAEEEA